MIRRLVERWLGYDRLRVAYEKVKSDNENLTSQLARLRRQHVNLQDIYAGTVERSQARQAELRRLQQIHIRVLSDLAWERFLNQVNDLGSDHCEKIRLMDHDQAWEVADILADRFGKPMYAYSCPRCPTNPITRDRWWHTTSLKNKRREPTRS